MSVTPPGIESDPDFFKLLTEIDMIAHMVKTEFERLLPDGLTQAQFGVLNRITRLGIEETVTELAAAFQVTQPTMTSTLKKLRSKDLVTFAPDKSDKRVKRVAITDAGRKMREVTLSNLAPVIQAQEQKIGTLNYDTLLGELGRIRTQFERRMSASISTD